VPMKGDLLWVYERLTQYYGQVLAARSGLFTAEDFRENTAREAARLSAQTGRTWRALEDTAVAVQTTYSARDDYSDYRRGAEYYPESALIWLEADVVIRQMSNGARSLDDFCRIFTGGPAGAPSVKPYDFDEVVATLNRVQTYDWAAFLTERVRKIAPKAPLAGIEGAGWKVTFTDHKSDFQKFAEEYGKRNDFSDSIGFSVKEDGTVVDVRTTSGAYAAGIAPSVKLIAVDGRQYTPEVLRDALHASKTAPGPLELLVKDGEFYSTHRVDYHEGERYPHLERDTTKVDLLSEIAKPRAN
jgi:predicted metalloprotease with PDZ domain